MDGVNEDERETLRKAIKGRRCGPKQDSIDAAIDWIIAMRREADRRADNAYQRGFNDGIHAGPLAPNKALRITEQVSVANVTPAVSDEMVKAFMSVYWRMAVEQYVEWRKHGPAPAPVVSSDHVRAGLEAVERVRVENVKP